MKVLLVEPKSSTTYPPMGLMKFSRYHKLKGDEVKYVVGKDKSAAFEFWDKIYITSVFTYDMKNLIETIDFYSQNLFNLENITVGGIAASLMPESILNTGVKVHRGLDDSPDDFLRDLASSDASYGYLLKCCPSIDNLPPDYGIVAESEKYSKIVDNAFFLYSTKGCPNKCKFCAVKTLEPEYVGYVPIKERIEILRQEVGDRAGLLFLDNNIAASKNFFHIMDEIIDCGYGVNEKMAQVKNGRKIYKNRFVDFNQGVDLRLLDKKKMMALAKIAINPLRLAFDAVELSEKYEEKATLAIECGITKLSNYMLYNFEDKPEDLYKRMEINTDIVIRHKKNDVKIFSFPMRYSPIRQTDRKFIGNYWTKREIRAIQIILNATHGIVSHSTKEYREGKGYFYRAFGESLEVYKQNLWMPFHYLINRDFYELDNSNISDWRHEYSSLSSINLRELKDWLHNGINKSPLKTKDRSLLNILGHYHDEHTQVLAK